MIRHQVTGVVNYGEWRAFLEDFREWNRQAERVGLPRYRLWGIGFGPVNGFVAEADFESLDDHVRRLEEALKDEAFGAIHLKIMSHTVPGSLRDQPLEPEEV